MRRILLASAAVLSGALAAHLIDGVVEMSGEHHDLEAVPHEHVSQVVSPWFITVLLVLVVALAVSHLPRRLNPLLTVLPFLAWIVQEGSERLGGAESLPFESNALKHFALGLLVQVPVALFIYLLVRIAVVVVRRLGGSFPQERNGRRDDGGRFGSRPGFLPKITIVARGSPTRGPPLLVIS